MCQHDVKCLVGLTLHGCTIFHVSVYRCIVLRNRTAINYSSYGKKLLCVGFSRGFLTRYMGIVDPFFWFFRFRSLFRFRRTGMLT